MAPTSRPPRGGYSLSAGLARRARRRPGGAIVSVLVHALIIAVLVSPWARIVPQAAPGLLAGFSVGGGGGGGGGGGVAHYISVPAPSRPVPRAPAPTPTPPQSPPPPAPAPVVTPAPSVPADTAPATRGAPTGGEGQGTDAGKGAGSGGGTGTGQGTGVGAGTGPGTGGGGGSGSPPEGRFMALPPNARIPKELQGQKIIVTFLVSSTGDVLRVNFDPTIADAKYRKAFEEQMLAYRFVPARDSLGRAVPGTARTTVFLGHN